MAPNNHTDVFQLPTLPVPHQDFVSYIGQNKERAITELVKPYNQYEAKLREGFAQAPDHQALADPNVNAVPVFKDGNGVLSVRARKIDSENLNKNYIMPLSEEDRKPEGAPATVNSMADFRTNFNLFSESSLADLDWSNVIVAGSSVVTPLLPVPARYNSSKKALREFYHEKFAPSSDVDLFIWGLDEAAAIEKIKQIESSVRNAILEEVTTVRTKNAITIVSRFPVRHVQIVLRLYKSVSEILTGFDVDCSCFAYDGRQIYGTPRGITALITQTNTIDLTRRSPSYESRLSKYAHRGFEIFWPGLDRSKVDPTIFERSFARTAGLARLLVLEQLPKPSDREEYLKQRREERARPRANDYYRRRRMLTGNIKDRDLDDVAEWVYDDKISDYQSFTIPYGPKYHARKIEKLLYNKDLLLNAEWNRNNNRIVNLHRHPCFVGDVDSIMHDCCGFCPEPKTDKEQETAQEEQKIYVSGDIAFMKDDPGRQAIGSFNPLTSDDWTDMAFVGNTQELCQRIRDDDLEFVRSWCEKNSGSVNRRDHTGRTPLHVAAQCSSPEIFRCLIDHGARIVARLVDGMTALHIVAARGNADMIVMLLEKSEENETRYFEKLWKARQRHREEAKSEAAAEDKNDYSDEDFSEVSSDGETTMTDSSFIKVKDTSSSDKDVLGDDTESEPDFYDIDVTAWDTAASPLHLAILGGHGEVIQELVGTFGADVLLPIKIRSSYTYNPEAATMTLLLAANLGGKRSYDISDLLLSLGASSAQADMNQISAVHYIAAQQEISVLKACIENDFAAARSVVDHIQITHPTWSPAADSPISTAIRRSDGTCVNQLLDMGAKPLMDLDDYVSAYLNAADVRNSRKVSEQDISKKWKEHTEQPVLLAIANDMPSVVIRMIDAGADINTIDSRAHGAVARYKDDSKQHLCGGSLLDLVEEEITSLEKVIKHHFRLPDPVDLGIDDTHLRNLAPGSYRYWYGWKSMEVAKNIVEDWRVCKVEEEEKEARRPGQEQKRIALEALKSEYTDLKEQLLERGAKPLKELYSQISQGNNDKAKDQTSAKNVRPFDPRVSFRISGTEKVVDGYLQLFEAAWNGDTAKIKELTLAPWGPHGNNNPLNVTTRDGRGFTPFTLAIYRRQFAVARLILGIANAQFKDSVETSTQKRYALVDYEEDNEYDEASEDDDTNELDLSTEIVGGEYTIDNIAELRKSVASTTSASSMLSRSCDVSYLLSQLQKDASQQLGLSHLSNEIKNYLRSEGRSASEIFRDCFSSTSSQPIALYVMATRDLDLLRFWLQCCRDASQMKRASTDQEYPGFSTKEIEYVLRNGHIDVLGEMIRIAGAELPLDHLVRQSGVKDMEKSKYYQGLSIRGKKMTSWARERGDWSVIGSDEKRMPFLLRAAYHGSLAAVEWFLSDTPFRLYREFGSTNKNDSPLRILAKAPGGFEKAVSSWLKCRNELALHAAIASKADKEKSLEVLKYLIQVFPDSLSVHASACSLTPLAFAFLRGRVDAAQTLIAAGANQMTRDTKGKNLIHLALVSISHTRITDTAKFRELLSLIDERLVSSLFSERCSDGPGSQTPLAYWLSHANVSPVTRMVPEIFTIMLEFGGSTALTIMDGSGQFPLHQAVKAHYVPLVRLMLEHDPSLLHRENAMGQTPLELAHSLYVLEVTGRNPSIRPHFYKQLHKRDASEFIAGNDDVNKTATKMGFQVKDVPPGLSGLGEPSTDWEQNRIRNGSEQVATYRICEEWADRTKGDKVLGRRRMISVFEAREVAKRLADRQKAQREKEMAGKADRYHGKKTDEVDMWLEVKGSRMMGSFHEW